MRYAVGDIHGYRRELRQAMVTAGLVDDAGDWSGEDAVVWFAGDLTDRGPDGVGVISDLMRWQGQAAEYGGTVASVLGNHDVLALAVRRFGDRTVPGGAAHEPPRSFAISWMINGGQPRDQQRLTDDMCDWLADLPAIARVGDDVVMHSDTLAYLEWGDDLDAVNAAISDVLHGDDITAWWEVWRTMTTRYAFLDDRGVANARRMLAAFGGTRLVHGHSVIGDLRGIDPRDVDSAWSYAEGLALAVDGGRYAGGPCLVVPLDPA